MLAAGRRLGTLCIHPAQLATAYEVFSPSEDELARARRVCAAWDAAQGRGAVAVDGRMIDLPVVVRRSRDLLAAAGH